MQLERDVPQRRRRVGRPVRGVRAGGGGAAWLCPRERCVFHHDGRIAVLPVLQARFWVLDQQYFLKESRVGVRAPSQTEREAGLPGQSGPSPSGA